jgi:SAM-dependent methyltransferase
LNPLSWQYRRPLARASTDNMRETTMSISNHISREPGPPPEKMPGHWLLARLGKRVLRPGGLELTRRLVRALRIGPSDEVVEFAPGLGVTAKLTLGHHPLSYTAVERDPAAAEQVRCLLVGPAQRCVLGFAEESELAAGSATVVYGEAMLSMQPPAKKDLILAEAARLLRPGGRYGIHELCLQPDDLDEGVAAAIARDLSEHIHVGVQPLGAAGWRALLERHGFEITAEARAPMHLLEPGRILRDEGWRGAARFFFNVLRWPAARRRIQAMRHVFHRHRQHLGAIVLVGRRREETSR